MTNTFTSKKRNYQEVFCKEVDTKLESLMISNERPITKQRKVPSDLTPS